ATAAFGSVELHAARTARQTAAIENRSVMPDLYGDRSVGLSRRGLVGRAALTPCGAGKRRTRAIREHLLVVRDDARLDRRGGVACLLVEGGVAQCVAGNVDPPPHLIGGCAGGGGLTRERTAAVFEFDFVHPAAALRRSYLNLTGCVLLRALRLTQGYAAGVGPLAEYAVLLVAASFAPLSPATPVVLAGFVRSAAWPRSALRHSATATHSCCQTTDTPGGFARRATVCSRAWFSAERETASDLNRCRRRSG